MQAQVQDEAYPEFEDEPEAQALPTVVCTDIIGHPYGLVKVVGAQAEVAGKVFSKTDPLDVLAFVAYQPDGNHIPIYVRQSSIALIGRESEEPIVSAPTPPEHGPEAEGEVLAVGG